MLDSREAVAGWLLAFFLPITVVAVGALIRPELFYDRFVWKHLYGPIVADSIREPSVARAGVEASPGYTVTSTAVYAYYLLISVVGMVEALERYDVGNSPEFFYALVPFGFLGGALRVMEDLGTFEPPLAYFFISPLIYVTMAAFTAAVFILALKLERDGKFESYSIPLAGAGALVFVALVLYISYVGLTQPLGADEPTFFVFMPVASLVIATASWGVVWYTVKFSAPGVLKSTGAMGAIVLWGHMLDAASTAVGVEHFGYGEKQPIVRNIIATTGTAYSFILVKAAIIVAILWAFDDRFFEDFERLPYLLLVAVLAVGLGPGTRNTLRAMIGV